jgi:hypothetical protein
MITFKIQNARVEVDAAAEIYFYFLIPVVANY